jgi:multidrug efflux system membrane fusion protein
MRGPLKRAFWFLAAILSLAGCAPNHSSSADQSKKGTKPSVPVVVAQAETRDVPVQLKNIGNVEAYATVTVRSQITGQITRIDFTEGQDVKAGDLLFTIDPRPAQGALRQAEADLRRDQAQLVSAKLEYERAKKLFESAIGSRDDYDKAEAAYRALEATTMSDEATVSRARVQVEFTSIRSPLDGRTGNLLVREGNIVKAPDDALVTINQVHPIYVTFSVPEQDLPAIRRRMRETKLEVQATAPAPIEQGFPAAGAAIDPRGELTFIDNAVDVTTGRIKLKATFDNRDSVLWPGQYVQTILTLSTLSNAVVVPSEAVQSSQSGDFVFVVTSDSTVQKRPVTTGLTFAGRMVITSGIQSGETVVTDGQMRLAEGSKVTMSAPVAAAEQTSAAPNHLESHQ